jgi:PAS domain S-box-containing protein
MEIVETERRNMMLKVFIDTNMDKYFSVLSKTSDAFLIIDLEGRITFISPACETIAGQCKESILGMTISELFIPKALNGSHTFFYGKDHEKLENFDSQIILMGGNIVDVNVTSIPIYFEQQFLGSYLVLKDITAIKRKRRLKEERDQRYKMLIRKLTQISEKQAVAGQLAAGVAHEIRNPLTAIKGFLQLLQSEGQGNDVYFEVMDSEINRIEFILKELMILAKPCDHKYSRVNIHLLLDQVLTLMESQALLNNIEVEKHYHSVASMIICDENQLKQVFINYIKNAIESMPKGGKLRIEETTWNEGFIQINFIDEGCGIPSDIISRIGEPFFTTKENGTGLGMLVSEQIIREHNGSILINSDSNGTCVGVKLPAAM